MAGEEMNEYSTDYNIIKPEDTQYDKENYTMGIHGLNDRITSNGVVNVRKEFRDKFSDTVINPTHEGLVKNFTIIKNEEDKEIEDIERRLCTVKEIYHYPIVGRGKKIRGYGIILKPDELKENESKNFIISYSYDDKEHPKFRNGEKVRYINDGDKTIIRPRNKKKGKNK